MYEEKIPFKRLGTVEEGYGQERQAAGKQIQILNTGNQTVTVKAGGAEGYVVGIPEGSIGHDMEQVAESDNFRKVL